MLSTQSAYVQTTLSEIQAGHERLLETQNRDVIGTEEWWESCGLPASGC